MKPLLRNINHQIEHCIPISFSLFKYTSFLQDNHPCKNNTSQNSMHSISWDAKQIKHYPDVKNWLMLPTIYWPLPKQIWQQIWLHILKAQVCWWLHHQLILTMISKSYYTHCKGYEVRIHQLLQNHYVHWHATKLPTNQYFKQTQNPHKYEVGCQSVRLTSSHKHHIYKVQHNHVYCNEQASL